VAVIWGLVYAKKTVALAYFASGVKQLTTASRAGDSGKADADFAAAQKWDPSDIYLQARAEAGIARANQIGSSVTAQSSASTTQAALARVVAILNDSARYAKAAVAYDPSNYYNYVSEARVAAAAAKLNASNAYESAVQAYTAAIGLNPGNPTLYLSLAQLQASANKLDDALRTVGAVLQVKNNYLDAVFLLSQIEAAKGNLADAITAAQVATQLNPQSPILFFQLGLLRYENKGYAAAAEAFTQAIKLQPDYANAQYFLGLSDARLGRNGEAIAQFQNLAASNPDNQEVAFILGNLRVGKSPFADAQPPITPTPEKRPTLPIKQKK
jgi:tetratricopeptide (TPR) repeat protein